MSSTNNKTIGVKVTAVLSRTIYIEVPEGSSDEDIINKAKDEVILPLQAIYKVNSRLRKMGVRFPKIDLEDWSLDKDEYSIIK